ncbi:hypothetical protein [Microvirga arsenatis]|uniref:HAD family hydrolase n=1 Tax=Microvirga arsenatis TaxID=2692265 RepID=A0ABW9Z510_9HYPH|nr:hypothetical protein [Microvirga arsenatis]NBJ13710.1 hypothetical protein [Microvirga arsenatis]NBJ27182.1 hypothetical protein [Microvirga arsenatis]
MTKTTFFDCDAVVYDAGTRAIHWSDGYLDQLQARMVEINLEDNPDRLGVLARTLRILYDWQQSTGPQLAWYLCQGLGELQDEVCRYAAQGHLHSRRPSVPIARLAERIRTHEVYRPFCLGDLARNATDDGRAPGVSARRRSRGIQRAMRAAKERDEARCTPSE